MVVRSYKQNEILITVWDGLREAVRECLFDPFTLKISISILLSVFNTSLVIVAVRICCPIKQYFLVDSLLCVQSYSRGPSNIYRGLLKVWLEILYVHLWIPCHIFCYFRLVPCKIC